MSCGAKSSSSSGQAFVDQRPRFDRKRKRVRRENQVLSRSGIIRRDKRRKAKFL